MRLFLALVCALLFPIAARGGSPTPCVPHDDASHFICKYGTPDVDDSTAYDNPRPPFVTRWLAYTKERVQAMYIVDGKMGDPPPYKKWKLVGFIDPTNNTKVEPEEAVRRLEPRKRPSP